MIYLLFLFIIGLLIFSYFLKSKINNTDDYIVAGRKVPWFLLAASLAANDIGAGASLGLIQTAASGKGLASAWYIWLMIPSYLIGSFVAPYLRKTNAKTVPEFFAMKYGRTSQIISAIFMIIPNIGIVAINIIAAGSLVQTLLNIDYVLAYTIILVLSALYSYFGGLWADILTDTIQIIAIFIGLLIVLIFIFLSKNFALPPIETKTFFSELSVTNLFSLLILYSANFIVGLSTTSRIYASKTQGDAKKGILFCIPFYFIYALIPVLIGIFISQFNLPNFEIKTLLSFFNSYIPSYILIFLYIGIISAVLTTVDTLLLGCSSIIYNDIIKDRFFKKSDEKSKTNIIRYTLIIISILSFLVAVYGIKDFIQFLILLLSVQTIALFIPFILGHFKQNNYQISVLISITCSITIFFIFTKYNFKIPFFDTFFISIFVSGVTYLLTDLVLNKIKK